MQGGTYDKESGAWIFHPTPEQVREENLKNLVLAIYDALPETTKKKIDPKLVEVIR